MKYVFGPVPSRRLGQSLGIDTIPLKTCNWNCVYCQLGRSKPMVGERLEYIPREDILAEVKETLASAKKDSIDWITFVGSGEPTLHIGIGWLIQEIKAFSDLPVAVITNGALLSLSKVRDSLLQADAVLPSFDAGNADSFRRINRALPKFSFDKQVEGLIAFREEYQGKLWVEVMLMDQINDSESDLKEIASKLEAIQPDEIHIILPTRPPAETWVRPSGDDGLLRARAILGKIAKVVQPTGGNFDISGYENVVDAIVGIITRHPMSQRELEVTLENHFPGETQKTLEKLEASGQAQAIERYGIRFWSASEAHYPESKIWES